MNYPAVAILGSFGFKPEYLSKFDKCETIYICLDGDKAGREGTFKIGELIGEKAEIIQLPDGFDLNDYFKEHSKKDFDDLTKSAKGIIKYEISLISPDTDKTELPQKLEAILKKLAQMEKAQSEAYLSYEIKPYFKLSKEDISAYKELINKYRKMEVKSQSNLVEFSDIDPTPIAVFDGLIDLVEYCKIRLKVL